MINPEQQVRLDVLDHGFVRLIDVMGNDLSIIRSARVSYDAAWRVGDEASDKKLMRRLWSGGKETLPESPKHSTPFEACAVTFEVMAPIFVFRQWHRHRTQSYNELSARYRELSEQYYIPSVEAVGSQSTANKQGRETVMPLEVYKRRATQVSRQAEHQKIGFELYRELIAYGWPRELARIHLGLGTYSHMFTTMNLLNFFRFASLRVDTHAQYEIQVYAWAMVKLLLPYFPHAIELFKEANP